MKKLHSELPPSPCAIIGFFDGACEPKNPGGIESYGAVIFENGEKIWEDCGLVPMEDREEHQTSNNVAEYCGFLALLKYLREKNRNHERIEIHGDSKLVIGQMFEGWKIKDGIYVPFAREAKELLTLHFPFTSGRWINREENSVADELSKRPLLEAGIQIKTH
jgi:ribonuclease HI